MNRSFLIVGITAVLTAVIATGCSDGQLRQASEAPPPDGSASAIVVSRADLINALWETAEAAPAEAPAEAPADDGAAPTSDADCLASSSFVVEGTTGFMIKKNSAPTETNTTPVVIVGPINLVIAEGDGRNAACGAGERAFIVTASAALPIDIELSAEASAENNIESVATDEPTPYPDACSIQAHFEQHGAESCDPADESESPEQAPAEEPTVSENGNPDGTDGEQQSASLNREEGAPSPQPGAEEIPATEPPPAADEQPPAAAGSACGGPSVKSFKLVVESYDCAASTFVQQPGA